MTERRPLRTELAPDARTMARGAAVNVGGALLTTALSFALSLVITHQIRATSFGLYSIALVTVLLGQVPATLGLDVGTVRFVALRASQGDDEGARASLQAALGIVSLVSGDARGPPLLAGALAGGVVLPQAGGDRPDPDRRARAAGSGAHARRDRRPAGARRDALLGARQPDPRGDEHRGRGARAAARPRRERPRRRPSSPSRWSTLVVAALLLGRALPKAFVPAHRSAGVRALLRFSLPQTLTSLLLQTILWTDSLLLGRLRPAAEVAVYTIVQRLLSPAQTVSTATGQMFAPRIAAEDARGDRSTLEVMLKRVTYWNVSLAIPVFALLLLVPEPLLGVFGPAYRTGARRSTILAAGQLFNAATGPLGQVINMSGRPYLTLVNNAAVAALNIVGCLILIPRYGLTGAACSTTASITLVNLIKLVQVRALFGINPFRVETARALVAGLAADGVDRAARAARRLARAGGAGAGDHGAARAALRRHSSGGRPRAPRSVSCCGCACEPAVAAK